jgi:hypothetical protein
VHVHAVKETGKACIGFAQVCRSPVNCSPAWYQTAVFLRRLCVLALCPTSWTLYAKQWRHQLIMTGGKRDT